MTTGWAPATASGFLNTIGGGSEYGQLHTGDPGILGTANPSAVTTREQITHGTSSNASPLTLTNSPTWSMTATETITHLSVWDAATSGNFKYSVPLGVGQVGQAVNAGDTVILDDLDIVIGPVAA